MAQCCRVVNGACPSPAADPERHNRRLYVFLTLRVCVCVVCFVRRARDGGFCGSGWSCYVQDLREGEGQSCLPDGETENVAVSRSAVQSQREDSCEPFFFLVFFQGTADPDRALTVARLV